MAKFVKTIVLMLTHDAIANGLNKYIVNNQRIKIWIILSKNNNKIVGRGAKRDEERERGREKRGIQCGQCIRVFRKPRLLSAARGVHGAEGEAWGDGGG